MSTQDLEVKLSVPFPTEREAQICYDVCRVSSEPPRTKISKSVQLEQRTLCATIRAPDARLLRVAVNGFIDTLLLIIDVLHEFGPPRSNAYAHYE